jgi:hypothetical protein
VGTTSRPWEDIQVDGIWFGLCSPLDTTVSKVLVIYHHTNSETLTKSEILTIALPYLMTLDLGHHGIQLVVYRR